MFRKMVSFTIHKDDSNKVIDTLSRFGECGMHLTKDGKGYNVSVICEAKSFRKCMDNMMLLSFEGVSIWNMDIRMSL